MKQIIFFILIFAFNVQAKICAPESPSLLNFACENDQKWTWGVGFGFEYGSSADASKEEEFEFEPAVILHGNFDWGQFFFEGQELGARFFKNNNFNFALVARFEPGRSEEDDPELLKGQGDSDDKLMLRPEIRMNLYGNWNVWFGATSLLGDSEIGNLHIALLGFGIDKVGIFDLELLVSQRWASSSFINKDFGVNAEQNARNGLSLYSASSGTQSMAIALVGKMDWSKNLKTVFEIGYDKYSSRLSDSPIIKKGQDYEYEVGATMLYLF